MTHAGVFVIVKDMVMIKLERKRSKEKLNSQVFHAQKLILEYEYINHKHRFTLFYCLFIYLPIEKKNLHNLNIFKII